MTQPSDFQRDTTAVGRPCHTSQPCLAPALPQAGGGGHSVAWGAIFGGEQGCWGQAAPSLPAALPQGNPQHRTRHPQQPPTTLFPFHCYFHKEKGNCTNLKSSAENATGTFTRGKHTACIPRAVICHSYAICHSYHNLQQRWFCSKLVCHISASKTCLCI